LKGRLRDALFTWPDARGWWETLAVTLLYAALALGLGLAGGLLELQCARVGALPLLLRVLVVPSLLEEVVFRVLPPPQWAGVALAAYILSHPLNAWLFWPAARPVFYDPSFLLLTALLGGSCALLYRRTRSLWPPVALHSLVVSGWLLFFGGEAALRAS
jgi:predicted Abi (CAAX) family protease